MRDYWVFVYLLAILCQLPFYWTEGRAPLSYDFAMDDAEVRLRQASLDAEGLDEIESLLSKAEAHLDRSDDQSSRRARIALDRGVVAWRRGRSELAIEYLKTSRESFAQSHGPDSFHVAAVDLRVGELLFLMGRYEEALAHLQAGQERVREHFGEHTAFPVRMAFREVSCLVTLNRVEEAAALATRYLADLRQVAKEQDDQFLDRTGGSLDVLRARGLFPDPPPGFKEWRRFLVEEKRAQVESKAATDE